MSACMHLQEAVQEALAMEDELTRIRLLEQVAEKEVRPMAYMLHFRI